MSNLLILSFRYENDTNQPERGEIALHHDSNAGDVFEAMRTLMIMIGFVPSTVDEFFGERL